MNSASSATSEMIRYKYLTLVVKGFIDRILVVSWL